MLSLTLILSVCALAAPAAFAAAYATSGATGDCRWQFDPDSGEIEILDATYIQRYLAGLAVEAFDEAAANVDGDKEVTVIDATYIQRYLAGIPTGYAIGQSF